MKMQARLDERDGDILAIKAAIGVIFLATDLDDFAEYEARGKALGLVAEAFTAFGAVHAFETDTDSFAASKNFYGVSVDDAYAFAGEVVGREAQQQKQ